MNEQRAQSVLDGQTALARKVFFAVPDQEPLAASKIHASLRESSAATYRTVCGCLGDLKASGLVKEVSRGRFLRVAGLPLPGSLSTLDNGKDNTPKLGQLLKPLVMSASTTPTPLPLPTVAVPETSAPSGEMLKAMGMTEVAADPLTQMAELTGELLDAVEAFSMKAKIIAKRLEDIAIGIETEREHNSKAAQKLKQLQAVFKDLEN